MTSKHIRLAAFTANKSSDQSWLDMLREWNQRWPQDAYTADQLNNFARDAREARRTLLQTPQLRNRTEEL